MKQCLTKFAVLGALLALSPGFVAAAPIVSDFNCPETEERCNGNLYGWAAENLGGDVWQIAVAIKVTSDYTGNKWTDLLNSIHFKSFASSYSGAALVAAPTGSNVSDWSVSGKELSANGCANGNSGGVCITWDGSGYGLGFDVDDVLSWTFQFTSTGSISDSPHLKYLYVDSEGKKVGDLGSFDFHADVPEPGALALLGLGLLGLVAVRRRMSTH